MSYWDKLYAKTEDDQPHDKGYFKQKFVKQRAYNFKVWKSYKLQQSLLKRYNSVNGDIAPKLMEKTDENRKLKRKLINYDKNIQKLRAKLEVYYNFYKTYRKNQEESKEKRQKNNHQNR